MAHQQSQRANIALYAVLLAMAVAAPFFFYPQFLMRALCLALFASAFNLLLGYAGLLSFGHAAFFGFAAYVSAYVAKQWGVGPELALLGGAATAGALGTVIGGLAIRRQGIYFAMITLALAQMLYFFCVQAPFTHGEDGIQAVPRGDLLGLFSLADYVDPETKKTSANLTMYYFVLAVFVGGFLLIQRIIHSPFGQILKAIREHEPRAISLGYNTARYKLLAFILSATLAGVAGGLFALVFQGASLNNVHWHTSGEVVLMTLLGGMGTMLGPVVGAFFIAALQQYLAAWGAWISIIQGGIFVACVLMFRRGIVGEIVALLKPKNGHPEQATAQPATPATAPSH